MPYLWEHPDWPRFRWNAAALTTPLAAARKAQGVLLGQGKGLGLRDLDAARSHLELLVQDSLGTCAIEGEKLDPDAVRSSVATHLHLPTAGLPKPPRPVDGLVEMLLDATARFGEPLTEERLKGWQAALFPTGYSGLQKVAPGQWRGTAPMRVVSGRLGREKVHFEAPPRERLEKEVRAFLRWFNAPPGDLDGLLRAGVAHLWFVTLHPFEDGNGRVTRALTDMALAQDEGVPVRLFSLSAQIEREREAYYDLLEKTQKGDGDLTPWLAWFLEQVRLAAQAAEGTLARVAAKTRFWQRHHGHDLNPRQKKVLNRLLDAGEGGFEGGMTTRKYAGLAHTSRATAQRDLEELVKLGCLAPKGEGRARAYGVKWEE